jgi:hypothetical protein
VTDNTTAISKVEVFDGNTWTRLRFDFANQIHKAVAFSISDSQILVFGGRVGPLYNPQESNAFYLIDLQHQESTFYKAGKVKGEFSMS